MTIESFNLTTAHLYGDALASQFRLRHRVFIERVDYKVPTWKGMEFDQFDTPATQYFVWRDDEGEVRGVARLAPTSLDYMLEKIWPERSSISTCRTLTRCGKQHDLALIVICRQRYAIPSSRN